MVHYLNKWLSSHFVSDVVGNDKHVTPVPCFFPLQHTANSAGSSAAMRSTWPLPHPLVVSKRTPRPMWTTASPCAPTPCVPDARRAAAGATWSTTQLCSASRNSSPSKTAPATGPPPRPRPPAPPGRPCPSYATTRAVCWLWAPQARGRSTPTVDYSGTRTCGRSATSSRRARWRGHGLSSITATCQCRWLTCLLSWAPVPPPPAR